MASYHVALALSGVYAGDLAPAPYEYAPEMHLFLSREVAGAHEIVNVEPGSAFNVTLSGTYSKHMSHGAILGIDVYTQTRNKEGRAVRVHAGTASVFLIDIYNARVDGYDDYVNLTLPMDGDRGKGTVHLRVAPGGLTVAIVEPLSDDGGMALDIAAPIAAPAPFALPDLLSYTRENKARIDAVIDTIIGRSEAAYQSTTDASGDKTWNLRPTWEITEFVAAPTWVSRAGKLPGFMLFYTDTSHQDTALSNAYYGNLLDIVLARHDFTEETFVDVVETQIRGKGAPTARFHRACQLLGEMVTAFANSLPYTADFVDENSRAAGAREQTSLRREIESFDDARVRLSSDCEDDAREELRAFREISAGDWARPGLRAMQALTKLYVPFGVLGMVTAQSLDAAGAGGFAAHMYAILMPAHQFRTLLGRTLPPEGVDNIVRNLLGYTPAPWMSRMSTVVCEGTGRLSTAPLPLYAYETDSAARAFTYETCSTGEHARETFARENSWLETFQKEAWPAADALEDAASSGAPLSSFYRRPVTLFTDSFFRKRVGVGQFELVYDHGGEGSARFSRGVTWESLLGVHTPGKFAAVPVALYASNKVSVDEFQACMSVLDHMHPTPQLTKPRADSDVMGALTAAAAAVAPFGKRPTMVVPTATTSVDRWIDVSYLRTAEARQQLADGVRATVRSCVGFSYGVECLTGDVGSLRLRFVVGS